MDCSGSPVSKPHYRSRDVERERRRRKREKTSKEEAVDHLPSRKDVRGPFFCQAKLELFQKATLGEILRDGVGRTWAFHNAKILNIAFFVSPLGCERISGRIWAFPRAKDTEPCFVLSSLGCERTCHIGYLCVLHQLPSAFSRDAGGVPDPHNGNSLPPGRQ